MVTSLYFPIDQEGRKCPRNCPNPWKKWTEKKYQPIVEAIDVTETTCGTIVTCKVSGTFPGSPVELRYAFTLDDEKIASLEIVS